MGQIRAIQSAETGRDYDLLLDMLRENITDWNWSDEDGEELPLPRDWVDGLAADEVVYLIQLLVSAKADALKH